MKRTMVTELAPALIAVALAVATPKIAQADMEQTGEREFRSNCAVCHGIEARGDGPMADLFDPRPPNLTLLSRQNGGFFPYETVFDSIDGRSEVAAHGPRDMPVWGEALQASGDSLGLDRELLAYGRILALTRYLERLQAE